jgi:hypothetical protein
MQGEDGRSNPVKAASDMADGRAVRYVRSDRVYDFVTILLNSVPRRPPSDSSIVLTRNRCVLLVMGGMINLLQILPGCPL